MHSPTIKARETLIQAEDIKQRKFLLPKWNREIISQIANSWSLWSVFLISFGKCFIIHREDTIKC